MEEGKHTYRCGTSIFIHHHEWRKWCDKQKHGQNGCECGKKPKQSDPKSQAQIEARAVKRNPLMKKRSRE